MMKTVTKIFMLTLFMGLITSCTQKPVRTISNLKAAFNGESTASAKYAAFADKALKEGFEMVAIMFRATSRSEAVHAENYRKVLEKMGEKITEPKITPFKILSTAENLAESEKGETYESHVMYPEFLVTAKNEKSPDANIYMGYGYRNEASEVL
jgi:rubrerythrin